MSPEFGENAESTNRFRITNHAPHAFSFTYEVYDSRRTLRPGEFYQTTCSAPGSQFATVEEIAAARKINASYVGPVLRLTLLAPEIVEAILDGRQPPEVTLAVLMRPLPVGWPEQQMALVPAVQALLLPAD